jgi:hypothetical protein
LTKAEVTDLAGHVRDVDLSFGGSNGLSNLSLPTDDAALSPSGRGSFLDWFEQRIQGPGLQGDGRGHATQTWAPRSQNRSASINNAFGFKVDRSSREVNTFMAIRDDLSDLKRQFLGSIPQKSEDSLIHKASRTGRVSVKDEEGQRRAGGTFDHGHDLQRQEQVQ